MDCCSSGCDKANQVMEEMEDPRVTAAAEKLASLLVETEAYQAFARASRDVQYDPEVANLVSRLNRYPGFDAEGTPVTEETLRQRIEALPVMQQYRQAEAAIRSLLSAVNATVSATAGIGFAENAAASACG